MKMEKGLSKKKRRKFWRWLMDLLGWTPIFPEVEVPKAVVCVAPHTSNCDFLIGHLFYRAWGVRVKPKFLIKKEWFFFPLNYIIRALGGVSVDRKRKSSTTEQVAAALRMADTMFLAITPEGTRSHSKEWKRGFYYIAKAANVPIYIAKIDYAKKEIGFVDLLSPDIAEVDEFIAKVRSYYTKEMARYPDKFAEIEE